MKGVRDKKFIDLKGQNFGRWHVEELASIIASRACWRAKCECGTVRVISGKSLRRGHSKSCGCLKRENIVKRLTTHGLSHTRDHIVWMSMKDRCYNQNGEHYKNYGGRGITVCDRWLYGTKEMHALTCFVTDMGPRPTSKHTLERVDNDKGYGPDNCKWATRHEQRCNTRSNRRITAFGRTDVVTNFAHAYGIGKDTLAARLNAGMKPETALTLPVGQCRSWDKAGILLSAS